MDAKRKNIDWIGDAKRRLVNFPVAAKSVLTYAIYLAEIGGRHLDTKPLTRVGADEAVCDHDGNTFRAVYTVEIDNWVYVLHCFQKKSKKGTKTPKPDIDLIRKWLKEARAKHEREGRNFREV